MIVAIARPIGQAGQMAGQILYFLRAGLATIHHGIMVPATSLVEHGLQRSFEKVRPA